MWAGVKAVGNYALANKKKIVKYGLAAALIGGAFNHIHTGKMREVNQKISDHRPVIDASLLEIVRSNEMNIDTLRESRDTRGIEGNIDALAESVKARAEYLNEVVSDPLYGDDAISPEVRAKVKEHTVYAEKVLDATEDIPGEDEESRLMRHWLLKRELEAERAEEARPTGSRVPPHAH